MSDVLEAVYRGDRAEAERLAESKELTVFEAAALGRTERLRELLDTDPSLVNAYGDDGFHPVGLACFFGNVDAARLLFERGADANQVARNERIQTAAIHAAAAAGDAGADEATRYELVKLALEHGADPNLPTQAGTTPLMAASGVNWVVAQTYTESPQSLLDAIQLCLDNGADVNAVNSMGLTALLGAANRGANDIIRLLVANGARVDVVDKEGRSALRWAEGVFLAAVGAERKPATIALLEELGAPKTPKR